LNSEKNLFVKDDKIILMPLSVSILKIKKPGD
jgi:hypothetical protein